VANGDSICRPSVDFSEGPLVEGARNPRPEGRQQCEALPNTYGDKLEVSAKNGPRLNDEPGSQDAGFPVH
jgi:hypothetical protein